MLGQDPSCSTVFVFRSKRADRLKMLVYDGTGLVLIWKRLEGAKFKHRPDDLSAASPVNHHRRLVPGLISTQSPSRPRYAGKGKALLFRNAAATARRADSHECLLSAAYPNNELETARSQ